MIISRIFGGLGNQLFIYAALKRLALKNNIELVLDHVSGFAYDKDFQRHYQLDHFNISSRKATASERLEPFSRIRRYIKRYRNKELSFEKKSYIQQEGTGFEPKLLNFQPKGKVYIEGYWQCENHFKDIEPQIREELCIYPPNDPKNLAMLGKIKSKVAVAIHFRFFNNSIIRSNTKIKDSCNTSIDYYKKAIKKMNESFTNAHYFVFSDQAKKVANYLNLDQKKMTIVDHNQSDKMAYADLWLMSNCQHFIIGKSTFSWWGAWISNNKKKIIIAPKTDENLLNFRGDKYLFPEKWIKI
tara:strand:- start:15947 stop:16843 length:897 start_codon:yes stop_codon:yes gene_type:complete